MQNEKHISTPLNSALPSPPRDRAIKRSESRDGNGNAPSGRCRNQVTLPLKLSRKALAACLLGLCILLSSGSLPAATLTNNMQDSFGVTNSVTVIFTPRTTLFTNTAGKIIYSTARKVTATNSYLYINSLVEGDYYVDIGPLPDRVSIAVPTGSGTYDLATLITNALRYTNQVSPIYVQRTGDTMSGNLTWATTTIGGLVVNSLTTAQRDALSSPANGTIIYNSSTGVLNKYEGGAWGAFSGSGTVTSVAVTSSELTIGGSPITSSGTITIDASGRASTANLNTVSNTVNGKLAATNGTAVNLTADAVTVTAVQTNSSATASRAAIFNSAKQLTNSTVTETELGYVAGVTSALQTQLDAKAATASLGTIAGLSSNAFVGSTSGRATNLNISTSQTNDYVTASRAAVFNSAKQLTNSPVTETELGYVSGVTSALQTQLDAKVSTANGVTTNTFPTNDWAVVELTYDVTQPTVFLADWRLGSTLKALVTKNSTVIHTNISANTNRSRTLSLHLIQDAVGTWAVGTVPTNGIVFGGTGGTNFVMNTNANSQTLSTWIASVFTNGQANGTTVTNAF